MATTNLLVSFLIAAWWHGAFLAFLALGAALLRIRFRKGLREIPGPFFASILPLDRILSAASGHQFIRQKEYHEKYGPLVRVGPNHVSIADANCITQIYGITSKFHKSDFYVLFDADTGKEKVPTVFSVRDESAHKALKRPVANAFSMSSLVELEPMTDACTKVLESKLDDKQARDLDLGIWLQWFAFDVITSITFSNRLGFMEQEKDVSGIIDSIEGRLAYNAVVGQAPTLHRFLLGNRLVAAFGTRFHAVARLNSARYIVQFAAKQLDRYKSADKSVDSLRDMLARFKRSRDGEQVMTDKDLLSHAASNIFAGSDTTAISLRSMFYYLCKNPSCYARVVDEIDEMDRHGELSEFVTFAEASRMKFLQACMKEAMRLHPSCGQLLERVVPEGGATISGVWLAKGTIVGVNPWIVGRDKSVYGDDANAYRPDRWLEADPLSLRAMERNFFAFGSGARSCLGKNVSLLEMSKLVPQLLRNYNIELSHPDREWTLTGYWFVKQSDLYCRVKRRARPVKERFCPGGRLSLLPGR